MTISKNDKKRKICFIGLGVMGNPISKNIAKVFNNITFYDNDSTKRKKFRDQNYNAPDSIVEASKDANIVITMLPTSKIVHSVIFDVQNGKNSLVNLVAKKCLFIDMSTGSLIDLMKLNKGLRTLGHRLIDAPVGRSPREAKIGKSLIMAGGIPSDIASAKPIFESFADTVIHVGKIGSGLKLKLVNNYMAMINHVLTGEVLSFANSVGLARELTVSVLSTTAAGKGQLLTNFPEKVLAGDISPDFSISMGIKDLNMALELAEKSNFDPSFGKLAHSIFSKATLQGMEYQDCTAILNFFDNKVSKPKIN